MGGSTSALVPELHPFASTTFANGRGPGRSSLAQDLERLLAPSPEQVLSIRARSDAHHARLSGGASSQWDGNEWFIAYHQTFPDHTAVSDHRMDTLVAFWGRFHWDGNPWIQGPDGKPLGRANKCPDTSMFTAQSVHPATGATGISIYVPVARRYFV